MTTYTWAGSTANWNSRNAWGVGAGNPGLSTADSLLFDGSSTSTSTLSANFIAQTSDTIVIADANVTVTFLGGRDLSFTTNSTSGITMSAGTFNIFSVNNKIDNVTFNQGNISGGIITVGTSSTANFTSLGTLTLSGGVIAATTGEFNIGTSGSTAAGFFDMAGGTALIQGGTIRATTASISGGTFIQSGGSVVITNGATLGGGTDALNGGIFQADTVTVQTSISFGGGILDGIAGGVVNAGTLTGFGTIKGIISGSGGSVVATGGVLDITNDVNAISNFLYIGTGLSVLRLDGSETTGQTITFASKSSGALELNGPIAVGGVTDSLTNFGTAASSASVSGDNFINVQGVTVGKIVVEGVGTNIFDGKANVFDIEDGSNAIIGKITLASSPLAGIAVVFGADSSVGTGSLGGTDIFLAPACFAAGTLIETTQGEVAVEDLTAGDLVVTIQDGQPVPMPVKWMGVRTIDIAAHPHPHLVAPVRIRAGAFGDDLPRRDLVVSTAHAIYADGKLVPANLLINNMTIVQELKTESVTYYHVELDRHSLILAEGLVSESYLDTGNRAIFSNAGLPTVLHPEFHVNAGQKIWEENACAPLAVDAETIAPIWHALAARAEALGHVPPRFTTTLDADVYLEADGRRLRPVAVAHGRHTFMLPAGTGDIVLRSRTSAPADLDPLTGDWRPLGVAVRSMTLHDGDDRIVIPADHPALTQGWHTPEAGNGSIWRWTAGNATIPVKGIAVPTMLDIEIGSTATYILTRSDREAQRLAA